jgi:hypothetical protein
MNNIGKILQDTCSYEKYTDASNEALHWIGVKLPTPPSELERYAREEIEGFCDGKIRN